MLIWASLIASATSLFTSLLAIHLIADSQIAMDKGSADADSLKTFDWNQEDGHALSCEVDDSYYTVRVSIQFTPDEDGNFEATIMCSEQSGVIYKTIYVTEMSMEDLYDGMAKHMEKAKKAVEKYHNDTYGA